jgi:hypothetical protein
VTTLFGFPFPVTGGSASAALREKRKAKRGTPKENGFRSSAAVHRSPAARLFI